MIPKRLVAILLLLTPWLLIGFVVVFGAIIVEQVVIDNKTYDITILEWLSARGFRYLIYFCFFILQPAGLILFFKK